MYEEPGPTFATLLRHFRIAAGLTQEDLAQRSGLTTRGIRRLETGDRKTPRQETVRLLSAALGLNTADATTLHRAARPGSATLMDDRLTAPIARFASAVPVPLTTFIGREQVIEDIIDSIRDVQTRLLTITGPPGVGKTRIAIEVGQRLIPHFNGSVAFVSLAQVTEPALVMSQIIQAIDANHGAREADVERLIAIIGTSRALLTLDNMEHVLDAALDLPQLLAHCPGLTVLATSRIPLSISGEHRAQIPGLTLSGNGYGFEHNDRAEAEELFLKRAREAGARLELVPGSAPVVAEICRRLDGLPLAIELAAARLPAWSLADLAAGIESILPELHSGPRDQPERLQTMVRSIEWSYSLLSSDEQRLLRRLAVFRGGFDAEAASAVAAWTRESDRPVSEDTAIRRALTALVDKNLVTCLSGPGETGRFGLLEMIREFATSLLQETGELAHTRQAHAQHYMASAQQQTWRHWIGSESGIQDGFADELPNFREALVWYESSAQPEYMLALASRLLRLWLRSTHAREGRGWLTRGIETAPDAPPSERALGYMALAQTSSYVGDHERAGREYAEALREATASDDPFMIAWSSIANASMANYEGDFAKGRRMALQAQAVLAQIDEEAQRQAIAAYIPSALGRAEHGLGNLEAADEHFRNGARQCSELGQMRGHARVVSAWGTLAVDQGNLPLALERFQASVALASDCDDDILVATNLRMLAAVLALTGSTEHAARLLGAVDSFEKSAGPLVMATAMDRRVQEQGVALLHQAIDREDIARAKAEGNRRTPIEAAAEVDGSLTDGSGFADDNTRRLAQSNLVSTPPEF